MENEMEAVVYSADCETRTSHKTNGHGFPAGNRLGTIVTYLKDPCVQS